MSAHGVAVRIAVAILVLLLGCQDPTCPEGLTGPRGPQGSRGLPGVSVPQTIRTYHVDLDSEPVEEPGTSAVVVYCHDGDTVISGGCSMTDADTGRMILAEPIYNPTQEGWQCEAVVGPRHTVHAVAICLGGER